MPASDVDDMQLPLRERSRRDKLRRIREATEQLLKTQTLAEITMRDVARMAGIGEATLFRYVAVKEDLLLHVFGHRMEDLITAVEVDPRFRPRPGASGRQVVHRVCELYRLRAGSYLDAPEYVTDYVRIGLTADSLLGTLSIEHGDRFIHVIESLLTAGQQDGVIAPEWDARTVASNCHGLSSTKSSAHPRVDFHPTPSPAVSTSDCGHSSSRWYGRRLRKGFRSEEATIAGDSAGRADGDAADRLPVRDHHPHRHGAR